MLSGGGFAGGIGDMFVAPALHHVIGDMDNVAGGMAVAAQQRLQRMVEQIGALTWICIMRLMTVLSGTPGFSAIQSLALWMMARRPSVCDLTASAKVRMPSSLLKSACRQSAPASRRPSIAG